MLICRPFITLRNGKIIYAHQKGLDAFCFEVSDEKHSDYLKRKKQEAEDKANKVDSD
jgi:hypothetical protein